MHSSVVDNSDMLVLYADGPCSTDGKLLNISLQFLPCPPGFSLNSSEGICGCGPRLQKYTTKCSITLTCEGKYRVGYDNHSEALILAHLTTASQLQTTSVSLSTILTCSVKTTGQVSYVGSANQDIALHLVALNACPVLTLTYYCLFHFPWLGLH